MRPSPSSPPSPADDLGQTQAGPFLQDLPQAARDYVEYIEKAIGVRISYVSVGAGRDEIIYR